MNRLVDSIKEGKHSSGNATFEPTLVTHSVLLNERPGNSNWVNVDNRMIGEPKIDPALRVQLNSLGGNNAIDTASERRSCNSNVKSWLMYGGCHAKFMMSNCSKQKSGDKLEEDFSMECEKVTNGDDLEKSLRSLSIKQGEYHDTIDSKIEYHDTKDSKIEYHDSIDSKIKYHDTIDSKIEYDEESSWSDDGPCYNNYFDGYGGGAHDRWGKSIYSGELIRSPDSSCEFSPDTCSIDSDDESVLSEEFSSSDEELNDSCVIIERRKKNTDQISTMKIIQTGVTTQKAKSNDIYIYNNNDQNSKQHIWLKEEWKTVDSDYEERPVTVLKIKKLSERRKNRVQKHLTREMHSRQHIDMIKVAPSYVKIMHEQSYGKRHQLL